MTWIEHSLVGTGIYYASKGIKRRLSLSLLLISSTLMLDIDHLWFRIGNYTFLKNNPSIELGFWTVSDTWTHSILYLVSVSYLLSYLFKERKVALYSLFLGGFSHLLGDWIYRKILFDMGLLWLWPFYWKLF
ncbi:MAG: metal-dependent hydrolase [Nitrospirota bacterium]